MASSSLVSTRMRDRRAAARRARTWRCRARRRSRGARRRPARDVGDLPALVVDRGETVRARISRRRRGSGAWPSEQEPRQERRHRYPVTTIGAAERQRQTWRERHAASRGDHGERLLRARGARGRLRGRRPAGCCARRASRWRARAWSPTTGWRSRGRDREPRRRCRELVVTTGGHGPRRPRRDAGGDARRARARGSRDRRAAARARASPRRRSPPLSRGRAGLVGACLVVNLPGSPKGVRTGLLALAAAPAPRPRPAGGPHRTLRRR